MVTLADSPYSDHSHAGEVTDESVVNGLNVFLQRHLRGVVTVREECLACGHPDDTENHYCEFNPMIGDISLKERAASRRRVRAAWACVAGATVLALAMLLCGCGSPSESDKKDFGLKPLQTGYPPNTETRDTIRRLEREVQSLRARVIEIETELHPVQAESSK